MQHKLDSYNSTLEHTKKIQKLNRDFALEDYTHFLRYFTPAFEDLYRSLQAVLEARQGLFLYDLYNERGCDIVNTILRCHDLRVA